MANLNHVGKVIANGRRCLVAYRTLPGDAFNCLIIPTESLQDSYHDALMKLVESNAAQTSFEFADVLYRSTFPDGSNMLVSLHAKGHLVKIATDKIEMIPNQLTSINLAELNQLIAESKGVSVQDLAIKPENQSNVEEFSKEPIPEPQQPIPTTPSINEVITDEKLAEKYRKDAEQMIAEAARLTQMAEELSPSVTKPQQPVVTSSETIVEPTEKPATKRTTRSATTRTTRSTSRSKTTS